MRDKFLIVIILIGFTAASSLLWLTRPSAIPVHPDDIFPAEVVQVPAETAPEKVTQTRAPIPVQEAQPEPAPAPLTLTLESKAPEISGSANSTLALAEPTKGLSLGLAKKPRIARPEVPKLKLFDEDRGTRGFSGRRWLSKHMGVEAGIGLTEGETLR